MQSEQSAFQKWISKHIKTVAQRFRRPTNDHGSRNDSRKRLVSLEERQAALSRWTERKRAAAFEKTKTQQQHDHADAVSTRQRSRPVHVVSHEQFVQPQPWIGPMDISECSVSEQTEPIELQILMEFSREQQLRHDSFLVNATRVQQFSRGGNRIVIGRPSSTHHQQNVGHFRNF